MPHEAQSSMLPIGGVFRCVMPVRWGDLDALNHVNNTLYFRYIEEARVWLLAQAGIVLPSDRVGLLAHASCDFLKPLRYPANVVVSQILRRVGRSSMDVDVVIECQDEPGVVYAKGKAVIVGTSAATGKSSPWTADELMRFAKCFKE